jgi:hypothetical protein
MLHVSANGVDDAVGTRKDGLQGVLVMCVNDDLFHAVSLGPRRMP